MYRYLINHCFFLFFMIKHYTFVKHITLIHILVRNAGTLRMKLIKLTSFQILLKVPKLSPLTTLMLFTLNKITYALLLPCMWHVSKIQIRLIKCCQSLLTQVIPYPGHFVPTLVISYQLFGYFVPSNNHFVPRSFRTYFRHFVPR